MKASFLAVKTEPAEIKRLSVHAALAAHDGSTHAALASRDGSTWQSAQKAGNSNLSPLSDFLAWHPGSRQI
jgi:hypothetical protein